MHKNPFSKKTNLFMKWRWALKGFSLRKKGSSPNFRRLLPLVEDVSSWHDGRRREESFEWLKDEDESLSNGVKISFYFFFSLLEEASMMSLTKEEVVRSHVKIFSLAWDMTKGLNSTLRLDSSSLHSWREFSKSAPLTDSKSELATKRCFSKIEGSKLSLSLDK